MGVSFNPPMSMLLVPPPELVNISTPPTPRYAPVTAREFMESGHGAGYGHGQQHARQQPDHAHGGAGPRGKRKVQVDLSLGS